MAVAKGIAVIHGHGISGVVRFQQFAGSANVSVSGRVTGLRPGLHGLRILLFGDESDGFASMGGIYNPYSKPHAERESDDRPLGILGNISADAHGVADFAFADRHLKLFGSLSILGRSVAVTEGEDDGGSGIMPSVDGNAGAVIGAGVIGIAAIPTST